MNQNSGSVSDEPNNEECSKKRPKPENEWILYAPAGLIATGQISFATMLGLFTFFVENICALSNIVTQSMIRYSWLLKWKLPLQRIWPPCPNLLILSREFVTVCFFCFFLHFYILKKRLLHLAIKKNSQVLSRDWSNVWDDIIPGWINYWKY